MERGMDAALIGGEAPRVSVVIPVFRDTQRLRDCCLAILAQSFEICRGDLVVVDNSIDGEAIDNLEGWVRVLREPNPGSYAARNRAIIESRADVLAFTDADCVPDRDWILEGVRALTKAASRAIVGGKICVSGACSERETAVQLYQRLFGLDQRKYVQTYGFAATANLFAWRRVFEEVGLFDATLFSGGDAEWAGRAKQRGYSICYADLSAVYHEPRNTLGALWQRERRVTGGHFERIRRAHLDDAPLIAGIKGALGTAEKWGTECVGVLADSRVESRAARIKLLGVVTAVSMQRAIEFLRLGVGGRPVR